METFVAIAILFCVTYGGYKLINKGSGIKNHDQKYVTENDDQSLTVPKGSFSAVEICYENADVTSSDEDLRNYLDMSLQNNGYTISQLTSDQKEKLRIALTRAYFKNNVPPERFLTLSNSTILVPKKELVFFCFCSLKIFSTKKTREFKAGSRGVSFRVAKGVSFRVGNSRGKFISREEKVYLGMGEVVITNAGARIRIHDKAKFVKFERVISVVRESSERLTLMLDGTRSSPISFEGESYQIDFLQEVISLANNT
ncbi:MAG TPA: hypothetical protein IAC66_07485 [Candidatus Aphodousia gallistercoris]|nr:hypothetical protein [Candidatus Aphodousia gallistercoris]